MLKRHVLANPVAGDAGDRAKPTVSVELARKGMQYYSVAATMDQLDASGGARAYANMLAKTRDSVAAKITTQNLIDTEKD
jgi:hypothetical protein